MSYIRIRRLTRALMAALMLTPGGALVDVSALEAATVHPPMLSHRAIYKVSLAHRQNRGQIFSVDGRMVTQWQETCDGLISEQRIVTDMLDEASEKSLSDISASSWESPDGLRFRFSMRQRLDNKLVAEYEGKAEYAAALGNGTAILRKPLEKEIKLPPGVLFPSAYMQALLDAARRGQRNLARQVFDGTSESDYYQVVSSIGAGTSVNAASQAEDAGKSVPQHKSVTSATSGLTWWPVQVSYYGLEKNEGLPEFEMAFKLYDNGVSADLTLDYGAFALFASLQRIEAYKRPKC
jgi:EipB-like